MDCHLLIPNLFWPSRDAYQDLRLPALEILLGRANRTIYQSQGMAAWLCQAFGVNKQQDWPVAPLTLAADGGVPGNQYWLRADPVHLRVNRDHLVLADSGAFSISSAEAEQLTDALNRHFNDDGLIFYPLRPNRWYLRLASPPQIETHALPEVAGKNINAFLPVGNDSKRWLGILNEAQVLLYNHPVNEAREQRGELPVNSFWLWGGGTAPAAIKKPCAQLWSNDNLATGLALASATRNAGLPLSATDWLNASFTPGRHLIVLDSLCGAAQYADVYGWREGISELEKTWFAHLLTALKQVKLKHLTISAVDDRHGVRFSVMLGDLWKLWRRIRPLGYYLESTHANQTSHIISAA